MAAPKKHKSIFGLDKLPTKAYIKALQDKLKDTNIQWGKDRTYITELEDELSSLKQLSNEELINFKIDSLLALYKKQVAKLKRQAKTHKKDYSNLLNNYLTLKNKTDEH